MLSKQRKFQQHNIAEVGGSGDESNEHAFFSTLAHTFRSEFQDIFLFTAANYLIVLALGTGSANKISYTHACCFTTGASVSKTKTEPAKGLIIYTGLYLPISNKVPSSSTIYK
jgi:hypothetical protein